MSEPEEIREFIRENYSKIAKGAQGGCCSQGCCCSCAPADIGQSSVKIGYTKDDLASVPIEANMGLGCGNPIAIASLKEGEIVLDLGSGGGFDCFLARGKVGKTGYVIGVDMTSDMISWQERIQKKSGYTNVEFRLGEIESSTFADESVDVILSNCVINLSLDKAQVFKRSLRGVKTNTGGCRFLMLWLRLSCLKKIRADLIYDDWLRRWSRIC